MDEHLTAGSRRPRIVVIVGPTASGKSELAVRLAESVHGEIVNADSMQFYSGMEIGTARPSAGQLARVPHHLYGTVPPEVNYTAAEFLAEAREVIEAIAARGSVPLVVGGTGLYIRALLSGLADSPPADEPYRQELEAYAEQHGPQALHDLLAEVDPESSARLHLNDRLRIIRALEVFRQTGRSFSAVQQQHGFAESWYDSCKIGIEVERKTLYARIDQRVDAMIAAGLFAEVQELLGQGYSPALKSMGAIGYRELCAHLAGRYSLDEAIVLIKRNSRHYAKRQLTWFKRDQEINWVEYPETFARILNHVIEFISGGNSHDESAI